jgi:quercetin dioxygenase-like cupin family protein
MPGFRAAAPAVATILVDDERTRVTRWDFEPGAETGHHVHGMPYIVVPITDMHVQVEEPSGVSERRVAAGAAYSRPSGVEHNIINASELPMAFIEVEIK